MISREAAIQKVKDNYKGKAVDGDMCQYSIGDGRRCAIGLFIPDDHEAITNPYSGNYNSLITDHPELAEFMPLRDTDRTNFQSVHDSFPASLSIDQQRIRLIDYINACYDWYEREL